MSSVSTLALFARLIVSLAVVIGLMWAAAAVLRRRGIGGHTPRRNAAGVQVELLARKSMGRNVSIAVVRVADQAMVVGITDHQVTTLGQTDLGEVDITIAGAQHSEAQRTALPPGPNGSSTAWKAMLEQLRDRTVRH
jgi:flagellar protein FliO/FliZ